MLHMRLNSKATIPNIGRSGLFVTNNLVQNLTLPQ